MKKSDYVVTVLLILVVVVAVRYFQSQEAEPPALESPPATAAQPVVPQPPPIRYPVPVHPPQTEQQPAEPAATAQATPEEQPAEGAVEAPAASQVEKALPSLDNSDEALKPELYALAPRKTLESLFYLDRIIRRFVVTVDNLPRRSLLRSKYRSNKGVPGQPAVEEDSRGIYLSEKNYARYDPFVALLEGADIRRFVALYVEYYPLIQAAYADLGYPSAYFNDRLIDVIDQLLETPDVSGRVALVRPHVLYRYADPALEALSAGQKVLIRIGPRNAAKVKTKLRELRRSLAGKKGTKGLT